MAESINEYEEVLQQSNNQDNLIVLMPAIMGIIPIIEAWLKGEYKDIQYNRIHDTILMGITLIIIGVLGWHGVIDSSGTTGLFGAIIGYVFGGFFHTKLQKG